MSEKSAHCWSFLDSDVILSTQGLSLASNIALWMGEIGGYWTQNLVSFNSFLLQTIKDKFPFSLTDWIQELLICTADIFFFFWLCSPPHPHRCFPWILNILCYTSLTSSATSNVTFESWITKSFWENTDMKWNDETGQVSMGISILKDSVGLHLISREFGNTTLIHRVRESMG